MHGSAYPIRQVDQAGRGGLQQHRFPEGDPMVAEFPEWLVEIDGVLGDGLDLFAEAFEGALQFVPQLPLGLLSSQVIPVMHVLMLAQVRRDFADLRVELHVHLLFLAEQNGILEKRIIFNALFKFSFNALFGHLIISSMLRKAAKKCSYNEVKKKNSSAMAKKNC